MRSRKKLIEVAIPLEAINNESAREKSIRHGHPSTLHLWWARRPLAACRAVLFASIVDDPSSRPDRFPTEADQEAERRRLFQLIEEMVKWENSSNPTVLAAAEKEILSSCIEGPPVVRDPFCGGGSIPLEAQRLGLEAHAGDLNPVAVLITKALIEIPPKFANRAPVHPETGRARGLDIWRGAQGLAEDLRYYGHWIRDEAERRIGHLYPKVHLSSHYGGAEGTVIAWIWARTIKSPNPAWPGSMPLVRSFALSAGRGMESWVRPSVDWKTRRIQFEVRTGPGCPDGTVGRGGAVCLATDTPVSFSYIRDEARAGRMDVQLMAIVAEGPRGRVYLSPTVEQEQIARQAVPPPNVPDTDLPEQGLGFRVQAYGMTKHRHLFTDRQLVSLSTFSDLAREAHDRIAADAVNAGLSNDGRRLAEGGMGATAYADAVTMYLAFAVDKVADRNSTLATWAPNREHARNTFTRQAVSMIWDFAEINPLSESSGNFLGGVSSIAKLLEGLPAGPPGYATQVSATAQPADRSFLYSTDPPYYDNVGYGDLADFFYVWLRQTIRERFPELFSTILVPKTEELIADPSRHSGKRKVAERHFESGIAEVFRSIRTSLAPDYPLSVYYAFKQSENDEAGEVSTGWETMLEGLLRAGFVVNGTWPLRTELGRRMRGQASNALATSILLVCRPRAANAPLATRKEVHSALRVELPSALRHLQQGNIAPVDLAQAAIGPGMGVFSRYAKVLEADGSAMTVRTALGLINQVLDETLAEQEADVDPETRWALAWFEQHGMNPGPFGVAETLSKAKNTAVNGLVAAGIVTSKAGKVRLLDRDELPVDWNPATDRRLTVWEVTQHLIRALDTGGEAKAVGLLHQVGGGLGETARELAYRLFTLCERKRWPREALAYNSLVVSWPEIVRLAAEVPMEGSGQQTLV